VALSLGLLQPDVIWCPVSMKPGLSSLTDFPFRNAAIRLPVYKVNLFAGKSKKIFIFFDGMTNGQNALFFRGYETSLARIRENRIRTLAKMLKIPIDSQKIPCYTIGVR